MADHMLADIRDWVPVSRRFFAVLGVALMIFVPEGVNATDELDIKPADGQEASDDELLSQPRRLSGSETARPLDKARLSATQGKVPVDWELATINVDGDPKLDYAYLRTDRNPNFSDYGPGSIVEHSLTGDGRTLFFAISNGTRTAENYVPLAHNETCWHTNDACEDIYRRDLDTGETVGLTADFDVPGADELASLNDLDWHVSADGDTLFAAYSCYDKPVNLAGTDLCWATDGYEEPAFVIWDLDTGHREVVNTRPDGKVSHGALTTWTTDLAGDGNSALFVSADQTLGPKSDCLPGLPGYTCHQNDFDLWLWQRGQGLTHVMSIGGGYPNPAVEGGFAWWEMYDFSTAAHLSHDGSTVVVLIELADVDARLFKVLSYDVASRTFTDRGTIDAQWGPLWFSGISGDGSVAYFFDGVVGAGLKMWRVETSGPIEAPHVVSTDLECLLGYGVSFDGDRLVCGYPEYHPEAGVSVIKQGMYDHRTGLTTQLEPPPDDGVSHWQFSTDRTGDRVAFVGSDANQGKKIWVGHIGVPPTEPQGSEFTDIEGSVFSEDIDWLASTGITRGCNPPVNDRFCPDDPVTRGQMAAFLNRALGLEPGPDTFTDTSDSVFTADIGALAAAGITRGCNPPSNTQFCPQDIVTRGQMAAFLVRALGYSDDGGGDLFSDDNGNVFELDIDRLGTAGVTRGCNPPVNDRFCPDDPVTRGQMAAFLRRALGG